MGEYWRTDADTTVATGRWPANTILTHSAGCRATGETKSEKWEAIGVQSASSTALRGGADGSLNVRVSSGSASVPLFACVPGCPIAELDRQSGASRFFTTTEWSEWDEVPFIYQAKPGKKERNAGLTGQNVHPTVKPVALMRHLVKLVTPPGGTVLDPFLGSGTTAVAALLEGFSVVGCEMTEEYLPIVRGRVEHALTERPGPDLFSPSE